MKNKPVSDNKNPISLQKTIYLGSLTALLLAGCNQSTSWEQLTGERPEQKIDGPRRTPLLNQSGAMRPTPELKNSSAVQIPAPAFSKDTGKPAMSPYDMYDANGNEVSKLSQEAPIVTNKNALPNPQPYMVQPDISNKLPEPKEEKIELIKPERKPLAGNPYAPENTITSEKNTPAPVVDVKPEIKPEVKVEEKIADLPKPQLVTQEPQTTDMPAVKIEELKETPKIETATAPKTDSLPEPQSTKENGDLFDRISSYFSSDSSTSTESQQAEYPKISSVPPKPEEFDAVKREKQQNMDELKSEHSAAQQEKENLEQEVSGTEPVKPLLPPTEKKIVKAKKETKEKTKAQEKTLGKISVPPSSVAPVVVEDKKPELKQPDFTKIENSLPLPKESEELKTTTTEFTAPVAAPDSFATTPEKSVQETSNAEKEPAPAAEEPSFFAGFSKFLSEASDTQKPSDTTVTQTTNLPSDSSKPSLEITESKPKEEAVQNAASSSPSNIPNDLPATDADSKSVSDSYLFSSFKPASEVLNKLDSASGQSQDSALPSPSIIKSMRPSRYEGLRKQSNTAN